MTTTPIDSILSNSTNPLDLKTSSETTENEITNKDNSINSLLENKTFKLIFLGLVIVSIVVLILVIVYKKYNSKVQEQDANEEEDMPDPNEELTNENEQLQQQIQALQIQNSNYVNHINRLADQLEEAQQYSPVLPMKEDSYDAPDPNTPQQKPQIVKDKELIKQMINSKRPTVQDELDNKQAQKNETEEQTNSQIEVELKETTHDINNTPLTDDEETNDTTTNNDSSNDKDVESLMNIIQSQ